MKTIKFIFVYFVLTIFTYSCGFKPIYSSNNFDLKFNSINFKSSKLNNQIVKFLKTFSNPNGSKFYDINLNVIKEKKALSKNSKGDTETFELKLVLNMTIETEGETYKKSFIEKIKYNNNDNKFELKQYEIEIEKQIITDLTEKIVIFFSEI